MQTENQQASKEKPDTSELERLRNEHLELVRLRGELGFLRRQSLSTNQNYDAQFVDANATESPTVRQLSPNEDLPRNVWADAGANTPEAALQTLFWALSTTNFNRATAMIKWDLKDAKEVLKQASLTPSDPLTGAVRIDAIPAFMQDAVSHMSKSVADLGGLRLLSSQKSADGQALLRFETTADNGKTTTGSLRFFGTVDGRWGPLMNVRGATQGVTLEWAEPDPTP